MNNVLEGALERRERTTMADKVYGDIRQLLITGAVPPGKRLTLRGLAEVLGTSPMPVRDAVARLVNDGALRMLPNRSVEVFKPTRCQFREIVTLRCCLEGLAAKEATCRLDDATLKRIAASARKYERAGHRKKVDTAAVIESNRELHFMLYNASGMSMLVGLIDNIWTRIAPMFALSMSVKQRTIETWESFGHHQRLIEALRARDVQGAHDAVVADIRDAADFIERSVWPEDQQMKVEG
ncbi:GntR family transcriptional regulator [Alcaligenaceae bacterium]|nr:GntR family transcriptional regulator [Alcaligenaceae bacterium]